MSAVASGLAVPAFSQDREDRPLPTEDVHWGVAHKPTMLVGVCSDRRVAVDIEFIKGRTDYQIAGALSEAEHRMLGGRTLEAYFLAWVAKEAVLKKVGVGLSHLSRTAIMDAWSDGALVAYDTDVHEIGYAFYNQHVAAITAPSREVVWTFVPEEGAEIMSPAQRVLSYNEPQGDHV
jgi:4'-phosphopantetheinyl transferase